MLYNILSISRAKWNHMMLYLVIFVILDDIPAQMQLIQQFWLDVSYNTIDR